MIILCALPQAVLAFKLVCKELSTSQYDTLLYAYTFSLAPYMIGFVFFLLPSIEYKKELGKTIITVKVSLVVGNLYPTTHCTLFCMVEPALYL